MGTDISSLVKENLLNLRVGIGEARNKEFSAYIEDLIQANEASVNVNQIKPPMLMDTVKVSMEAAYSATAKGGVEGGVEWKLLNISGDYSKESQTGVRMLIDVLMKSEGAADVEGIKANSVDDLKKLMEVVEK